jgi:DNA-binding SARP family transcriptional activator
LGASLVGIANRIGIETAAKDRNQNSVQSGGADRCEVKLLKGFQLTVDGCCVGLPTSAQRLVAYLALQERPLQRSYVAGVLWTDSSTAHSMGSLRSSLWRLHDLGRLVVEAVGQQLRLSNSVAVDARRTMQTARLIDRRELSNDSLAGADFADLIESGELLPDWYEDWVVFERERLRQMRLHALESLSIRLAEARRFALAIEAALAAVKAEPLRDSAHRALIGAHLMEGNRCEALRQYNVYVDVMRRELNIPPSVTMEQLSKEYPAQVTVS